MVTLNIFQNTWGWFLENWFWVVIIIAVVIFLVKKVLPMIHITWRPRWPRRWPRWNWKIVGWAFAFVALFLLVGLFRNYQNNRRMTKAENRRVELAEAEAKKWQIISEIPEEKRDGIEKSQTKSPEVKRKYPVGHSIVVTIQCGETKTVETGNQPYKRLGLSGQTECLEVSSNNFSWHKVPYTFNRSPQKEFVRNKGTSPVEIEYVFQ